jgi:hypothetical protein
MTTTATVLDWFYSALRWTWHDPDGYVFISGDGTGYVVCRRHHPHPQPTAEQIHAEHAAHQRQLHEAASTQR